MIELKCQNPDCEEAFEVYPSYIKRGRGITFCSQKCRKEVNAKRCRCCGKPTGTYTRVYCSAECRQKGGIIKCRECNKEFYRAPAIASRPGKKFCSRRCRDKFRKGRAQPLVSQNPFSRRMKAVNGCTKVYARWLMEEKLKRKLHRNEVVHHIDHNHRNDVIENLVVLTSSEHRLHHIRVKREEMLTHWGAL